MIEPPRQGHRFRVHPFSSRFYHVASYPLSLSLSLAALARHRKLRLRMSKALRIYGYNVELMVR